MKRDQNPLTAEVRIYAHAGSKNLAEKLTLSSEELDQVAEDLQNELRIRWVPPVIDEYAGRGIALETTLLITVAGSAVSLLFAGIMQETGKDVWNAAKHLVSKLWAKQSEQAYNLNGTAYLIIKEGNKSVAIDFTSNLSPHGTTEEQFRDVFEEQQKCLDTNWDSIKLEIERLSREKRSPVYRVTCRGSVSTVTPLPSWEYLRLWVIKAVLDSNRGILLVDHDT